MIFRISVALSIFLAAPVFGKEDICPTMGKIAAEVMTARQNGVAMSILMTKTGEFEEGPMREFGFALVRAAYDVPRMHSELNQKREIEDFRNEVEATCYRRE